MFELVVGPVGAVVIAGVVHLMIGAFWYSPAGFAVPWMRGLGITQEDIAEARIDVRAAFAISALASFGQAAALVALYALLGLPGVAGGVAVGLVVGAGFGLLPKIRERLWADRPWAIVLVDGGYEVTAGAVAGGLVAWLMGMA